MSDTQTNPQETLQAISEGNLSVLDQLARMTEGSFEGSGLDAETFLLVRLAALSAMDAAPASWLVNLAVGKQLGIPAERAIGTLIAIAPVVGTARVVSAAGSIVRALGIAERLNQGPSA
jgi:4-carboxymuconolactone decarboxylase